MNFLDLFSGLGGFPLAAYWSRLQAENHYFSEVDPYAVSIYQRRFPDAVALGDCRVIEYGSLPAGEWMLCGGFPCQPHSLAGKREAGADERDLWPECARALRELRPAVAVFENVPGLFSSDGGRFFNRVLSDIAALGYDAEWTVISALDVGAPHLRKRVWIIAYADGSGIRNAEKQIGWSEVSPESFDDSEERFLADSEGERGQRLSTGPGPDREGTIDFNGDGESLAYSESNGCRAWRPEPAGQRRELRTTGSGAPLADAPRIQQGREIERPERERIGTDGESTFISNSNDRAGSSKQEQQFDRAKESFRSSEIGMATGDDLADPNSHERHRRSRIVQMGWVGLARENEIDDDPRGTQWKFEPRVRRILNGVPERVDRLKSLGNAIVPQVAEIIFNLPYFDKWRLTPCVRAVNIKL